MSIVLISGSVSANSRSERLLDSTRSRLEREGERAEWIAIRDLPSDPLLRAQSNHPRLHEVIRKVVASEAVVIASPIYNASFTGILKAFLDLLPQRGLDGKILLHISTAGSPAHTLALEYALRPVLTSLGGQDMLPGVFAVDTQVLWWADAGLHLDPAIEKRLDDATSQLITWVTQHRKTLQIQSTQANSPLPISALRFSS